MNVFDCAMKMETEARTFYEKLAAAAKEPELKNLFNLLAAAEEEHHEGLKTMKESKSTARADFKALNEAACVFKPLVARKNVVGILNDDPDGYRHVVKEEEESIAFYEDLAAKAENEEARKMLMSLAEEEKKHLNIVENIYSFVESPRTYLAWGEFSNLREY